MKIDVTLEITPKMVQDAQGHDKKSLSGHLGTHFDRKLQNEIEH